MNAINLNVHANTDSYYHQFFAQLIKAQLTGHSSMPYQLGLSNEEYKNLLADLNDQELFMLDQKWQNAPSTQTERSDILLELVHLRKSERDDIVSLLVKYRNQTIPHSSSAATIIATGCLSAAHLWNSLGFSCRTDLSDWIKLYFPYLATINNNMRWKRFFYLQLCKQGGDYVCRAPTCSACSSFDECFLNQ